MNSNWRLRSLAPAIAVLAPAFVVIYEIRGEGLYTLLLAILLASLGILTLKISRERKRSEVPQLLRVRERAAFFSPYWLITTFSVITAISAVFLESHVLTWIGGKDVVLGGLPRGASIFLLFFASFLYVYGGRVSHERGLFEGRPRQILSLSALAVLAFTLASVFWKGSMDLYTAAMKSAFALTLGAYFPVIIKTKHKALYCDK